MQLPSETLLQGGKYRIIEKIGQGGFGITYKAEDTLLDRKVAIKEFFYVANCERQTGTNHVTFSANNSELVTKLKRKFLNEAKRLAKFNHNSIVSIYDVFEENGTAYFAMEYIKSGSLDDLVCKSGRLLESKALEYMRQMGEVLHYLHTRQTCHLDIKPTNILLDETGRIKLIDFGLSKQYEVNSAHTTTLLAVSKGYAPIEQYSQGGISDFSPTADIYSLGATLYFLLKGEAPPEAIQLVGSVLPEINNVSDVTNAAIQHAMKAISKERPQSVTEWLAEIEIGKNTNSKLTASESDENTLIITSENANILQIERNYEYTDDFIEDLALVKFNNKWGFINRRRQEVISLKYDGAWSFCDGLAKVRINEKYGFIDKTGKVIIPLIYDSLGSFREGFAYIREGDKYGYINKYGKKIIEPKFNNAYDFHEGRAKVEDESNTYAYIDTNGSLITGYYRFTEAYDFDNGRAKVRYNMCDYYNYINVKGQNINKRQAVWCTLLAFVLSLPYYLLPYDPITGFTVSIMILGSLYLVYKNDSIKILEWIIYFVVLLILLYSGLMDKWINLHH